MAHKKESNPYILKCSKCGTKTLANVRRRLAKGANPLMVNKTNTSFKPCSVCSQKGETRDIHNSLDKRGKETKTIHRIVGKVTRIRKNSLIIKWF